MKTREQVLAAVRSGELEMESLDGRDFGRLASFFPREEAKVFGFEVKPESEPYQPREWTEEEVKKQLKDDVEFGFKKALGKRSISASCMYSVVRMWMWVLEDELYNFKEYALYGLPLLKAVAIKYGFPNPIGEDSGSEGKYAE